MSSFWKWVKKRKYVFGCGRIRQRGDCDSERRRRSAQWKRCNVCIGHALGCGRRKPRLRLRGQRTGVAAPVEVESKIARMILDSPDVTDINKLRIIQEGRAYHVEGYIELRKGLTLADADDIKFRVRDKLLAESDITDVTLGIIEDNGVQDWKGREERPVNGGV